MDSLRSTHRLGPVAAGSGRESLRVLCYNIRHCHGLFTPFISERRTARAICRCEPDIVGLTEVYRTSDHDQPARLSRLTRLRSLFYGVRPIAGGEYGNLLLSRFPLREVLRIPLGGRDEDRGCLLAEIETTAGVVYVGVTHLGLDAQTRRAQIATLVRDVPRDRPLILMGDFNGPLHELEPLLESLCTVPNPPPTFPSAHPVAAIDLILFSDEFEFRTVRVPRTLASDHRPVVAELVLPRGSGSS